MTGFTDIFIRRPVLAAVISLLLLLLGAVAYGRLAVRETPDVQSPVVTVSTFWPGADPAIVESDVTEPLERELNGIEGVRVITSTSQEQSSRITVEFDLEADLEAAANDVRSRVARARDDLPEDVEEPVVEKADANAQPVLFLRLASDTLDLLQITEIADTLVRERLENTPGVSGIDLFGAQIYAMRVELDPVRLASRRLTLTDVQAALSAGNVDLPAGRVEGAATQLSLQFQGGLRTVEDFGALVVGGKGDTLVRLRDVATLRVGAQNERTAARADGVPSISLAITPQAKANVLEVSDEIQRRLPLVRADLPAGMELEVVFDRADAVRQSIHDVQLTLWVAFGLVTVVIFAFLRDWRSTLVPALAIPVSIVGTFLFLWLARFSVNVFTLFGLVLAIGLVVDDAIVVLENIVRRVEEGESVLEASLHGTRQIAFAVIATTLSLVAVFLPVLFTGGTTGKLFLEFGVTVAVAVAISAVVALTLTPMLCSKLLREPGQEHRGAIWRMSERHLQRMNRVFARTLAGTMRRPWIVLPALAASLAGGWLGFSQLPREFFPIEDRGFFMIRTFAQEGTSFTWMDARMRELEEALMPLVPERRVMLSRVAMGPGGVGASPNVGMIMFPLVPMGERTRSQQEIVNGLKPTLGQVTAFRTIPIQSPTIGRGFSTPLQFVIQHADFDALVAALPGFLQKMREVPGLSAVNEDLKLDRPELVARIDREKAAAVGVSLRDVARTLQVLSSGVRLSDYKRGVRQYEVIVGLPAERRDEPSDLGGLYVRGRGGEMVPLSNLVRFEERAGAAARFHYNRAPSATISANLDGITLGEGIARARALAATELPEGFRTALDGQSKEFEEASSSLGLLFGLALALVYLLLAAQFDSFVAPVSILVSVPLALVGAFAALASLSLALSFFAQVGLILLVGLVTKNGILIVEYAQQLREHEGLGPWEAAEQAAKLRFRPILMTSVATIGGAVPIAVGFSGASREPLGVAVAGGMFTATLLTLYVTPVVYATLASIRWPGARAVGAAAVLLTLALPARAESPELTLAEALRVAMRDSRDIHGAEADVRYAEATADATRAALLPSVSADASAAWGYDPRLGADLPAAAASTSARLDVPILDLGGISAARAARYDAQAELAAFDATVEDTLATVASRFVALQQAREAVVEAEARRVAAERLSKLARDRVEVGAAPPIDGTRAALQQKREEAALLAARTAEEAARLSLAEALGVPLDAPLPLSAAGPLLQPDALPTADALDAALAEAHDMHPALVAARRDVQAAEADRRAVVGEGMPVVGAWGQAGTDTALSTGETTPSGSVGVAVSVPIFEGGGRVARVRAASAGQAGAEAALSEEERAVEAALRIALRRLVDAAEGLAVAEDARALAEQELASAEERYRAGAAGNLEVVQAQVGLAAASGARVDALAAYNLAAVAWFSAQGRLRELAR